MNRTHQTACKRWMSQLLMASLLLGVSIIIGCGAAGSPIAPEDVGLEAKIRKQQKQRQPESQGNKDIEEPLSLEEEPLQLPPLHPVGTR